MISMGGFLIYVRYGDLPPGNSMNHLTGMPECGVSCYEAICRDGVVQIILPPAFDVSVLVSLSGPLNVECPLYVVTGERVGTGSDGEPLLSDCAIVGEVKNSRYFQKMEVSGKS